VAPSQDTALIPFHSCGSLSYLKEDVNGDPVARDCRRANYSP